MNPRDTYWRKTELVNFVKFAMKSWKFLMNVRRNIPKKFSVISWGNIPEKFSVISWDYVFYAVPWKIREIRDQVLRISQEFPEKNSVEILRNFSKLSVKTITPQKTLKLGINSVEFLENFRKIIHRTCSWEIPWNF